MSGQTCNSDILSNFAGKKEKESSGGGLYGSGEKSAIALKAKNMHINKKMSASEKLSLCFCGV